VRRGGERADAVSMGVCFTPMPNDDIRSRVATRVSSAKAPLPTSAIGRRARLIAGLATAGAKSVGRSVRRTFGRDASDVEPEAQVTASIGQLKGLVMKVGQALGYMDAGLPDALRSALSVLQTSAQPLDADRIRRVLDEELGDPGRHLARAMQSAAISSASVGQVHRSTLPDGTPVAVKIVHPDLAKIIARDLGPTLLLSRLSPPIHAMLEHVRQRLVEECDYSLEARRQARFGEIFAAHETITVPEVYRAYSSARVLTTAFIEGEHIDAYLASRPSQEAKNRAGEALFDFYVAPLFQHGLYNCDPHPGNYLFTADGRVAVVDFGCAREFEPSFVGDLASLTRAVMADDRGAIHDALVALGLDEGAPYDREALRWLLHAFYGPLMEDGVRAFDLGAEVKARQVLKSLWKARRLAASGEVFFLLRTFVGLSSVLARLDARANWRRRLERVVAAPAQKGAQKSAQVSAHATSANATEATSAQVMSAHAKGVQATAAQAAPKVEEVTWDIVLVHAGASPIALIRELRELTGMDLRDLEGLVDSVPQTLRQAMQRAEAEALRQRLETVGAQVEVRRAAAQAS
jgi:predicted unusual protein kinase regulating ubiquinone biosynthesis (AarF/ABC1/UbiB family)